MKKMTPYRDHKESNIHINMSVTDEKKKRYGALIWMNLYIWNMDTRTQK